MGLHVDLDQFIAAVEVLRHPELAGLPVIVGGRGDPTERAVVSTGSYEARALRAQPGAIVQVLGWDEAFIGIDTARDTRRATRRGTVRDRVRFRRMAGTVLPRIVTWHPT